MGCNWQTMICSELETIKLKLSGTLFLPHAFASQHLLPVFSQPGNVFFAKWNELMQSDRTVLKSCTKSFAKH